MTAPWCGGPVEQRHRRGSAKRFCLPAHRIAYHLAARRYVDGLVQAGQLSPAELAAPRKACTLSGESEPVSAAVTQPETAPADGWRWRELLAAGRHPCGGLLG